MRQVLFVTNDLARHLWTQFSSRETLLRPGSRIIDQAGRPCSADSAVYLPLPALTQAGSTCESFSQRKWFLSHWNNCQDTTRFLTATKKIKNIIKCEFLWKVWKMTDTRPWRAHKSQRSQCTGPGPGCFSSVVTVDGTVCNKYIPQLSTNGRGKILIN